MGKSFVHDETSRAVEIAEGEARPGRTVRLESIPNVDLVLWSLSWLLGFPAVLDASVSGDSIGL
jgi:hypothetical protein